MLVYLDQSGAEWHIESEDGASFLPVGSVLLTPEQVAARRVPSIDISSILEAAIDDHIDAVAAAKGYGKRYRDGATEACMKYASFPNKYQAEAIAFGQWIVSVWDYVFQVQAAVLANSRPIPTKEQLIAELPVMVWPV